MNPLLWSFRIRCLLAGVACFALIGFAIYSQFAWGLDPCPLCIFQRIAFAALGLVCILAGLHAPKRQAGRRIWGVLGFIAAAVGIGIAGRHVWIQLNPPPIPSCGAPLSFLRETMDTQTLVHKVLTGTGDCGTIDWSFLGLTMPMWSLLWFVLFALWMLHAGFARARRN